MYSFNKRVYAKNADKIVTNTHLKLWMDICAGRVTVQASLLGRNSVAMNYAEVQEGLIGPGLEAQRDVTFSARAEY